MGEISSSSSRFLAGALGNKKPGAPAVVVSTFTRTPHHSTTPIIYFYLVTSLALCTPISPSPSIPHPSTVSTPRTLCARTHRLSLIRRLPLASRPFRGELPPRSDNLIRICVSGVRSRLCWDDKHHRIGFRSSFIMPLLPNTLF
jgi:hypothetical protein